MNCPACKQGYLKPIKITEGLPALGCNQCQGYLLSMYAYRRWLDRNTELMTSKPALEPLDETSQALICPKCQVLMTKYRISGATQNKLDSCGNCGEIWIDNGEWALLLSLGIAEKLSSILLGSWQKDIRQQESQEAYEQRFKALLGDLDYTKLSEFDDWINQHQHAQQIRNYLAKVKRW